MQVSITGLKPQTPFGVPEFFVQAVGHAPRTCWKAIDAFRYAVALGMPEDAAFDAMVKAMEKADPKALENARLAVSL